MRLRLESTVVRVRHLGEAATAREVEVTYARGSRLETVRARRCVLLFLTTAARREDAHAFYRRVGLEETGTRFTKALD